MLVWQRPTTFVNARVVTPGREVRSIRFGRRILALDEAPSAGDRVVDLDGRIVLPGLVNAHDHLELNHYGPLRPRARYANAGEWIADLRPLIRDDPDIRRRSRAPLADRLFIGGIKNLLAGVTTVAHHNPIYRAFGRRFPVRVLRRMGWAHSLGLEDGPAGANGEPGGAVYERCRTTPPGWPFVVHAAEGVDETAAGEVAELDARGCLRENTVLVHGVAVASTQWLDLFTRGVSLAWCPASNLSLFGRTVEMPAVLGLPCGRQRVCLGTDSRLTGARDLLDELRVAAGTGVAPDDLLHAVTAGAASVLRLEGAGELRPGAPADLCVIPAGVESPGGALLRTTRASVSLVLMDGRPVIAEPSLASVFRARGCQSAPLVVDGAPRLVEQGLMAQLASTGLREEGVEW